VPSKLDRHAEQLSALGHPVRLAILRFVVQRGDAGSAAGDIQTHVDLPADAGLLKGRSEGTFLYYSAEYTTLRALTDYLWEDCCKRGKPSCC
jgi:ArsR family transcriptional regulator